jgi:hypothetical protein
MHSPLGHNDYALTSAFVMCPDLGEATPQIVGMGVQLPLRVSGWPILAATGTTRTPRTASVSISAARASGG